MKFRDEEGTLNAVEIDRTQMMIVNAEKMSRYREFSLYYKNKYNGKIPLIHFFTMTEYRQKSWSNLAKYDVYAKVYVVPGVS